MKLLIELLINISSLIIVFNIPFYEKFEKNDGNNVDDLETFKLIAINEGLNFRSKLAIIEPKIISKQTSISEKLSKLEHEFSAKYHEVDSSLKEEIETVEKEMNNDQASSQTKDHQDSAIIENELSKLAHDVMDPGSGKTINSDNGHKIEPNIDLTSNKAEPNPISLEPDNQLKGDTASLITEISSTTSNIIEDLVTVNHETINPPELCYSIEPNLDRKINPLHSPECVFSSEGCSQTKESTKKLICETGAIRICNPTECSEKK